MFCTAVSPVPAGGSWPPIGPSLASRRAFSLSMWTTAVLLLALLAGQAARPAAAANFETATVDAELAVTSEWEGGWCGSLM